MSRKLTRNERSRAKGWERKHPRKATRMREGLMKFIVRSGIASLRRRARHRKGR